MRSTPISWQNIPQGHPTPPGQVAPTGDQFRASLQRHIEKLIEEEESHRSSLASLGGNNATVTEAVISHRYAASLLREVKAWVEIES